MSLSQKLCRNWLKINYLQLYVKAIMVALHLSYFFLKFTSIISGSSSPSLDD